MLLGPRHPKERKSLLVAGSIHGDEQLGTEGIVRLLETKGVPAPPSEVYFLPVVNPSGYIRKWNYNRWYEDPEKGWVHQMELGQKPSREYDVLHEAINWRNLIDYAKDGYLAFHEDPSATEGYIYFATAGRARPSRKDWLWRRYLRSTLNYWVGAGPDRAWPCDGSMGDALLHDGVPRIACVELPRKADPEKCIQAAKYLIVAAATAVYW